jgi:hypothetical protein
MERKNATIGASFTEYLRSDTGEVFYGKLDGATLTECLPAADNTDDSIDGAAKITHRQIGEGVWLSDDGARLDDDPDGYRVECSCGAGFGSWGKAAHHVNKEH